MSPRSGAGWTRREVIRGARRPQVPPAPPIRARAEWAGDLLPTGPIGVERLEDILFLLVHHTASPNNYRETEVPGLLQSFYGMHTGPDKGWPDLAYNFMIDRFGRIWEGRAGSLAGPVKGDATGGSQGFAQLCCLIGDHSNDPPTPAAQAALIDLLAFLAGRYGIDPTPGTQITFTSRGSNRWPAGSTVTTTTIAGHRDMSATVCPGDGAYGLIQTVFAPEAARKLAGAATTTTTAPPTTTSTTAAPPATSTTSPPRTSTSTTSETPQSSQPAAPPVGQDSSSTAGRSWLAGAAIAASAAIGGVIVVRRRRV